MAEEEGGKQTEKGEGKGIDSWTGTSANVLFKAVGVAAASWLVIYELIPKSWTPWGWLRTLTRDLLLSGYVIDRLALAPFASRNLRIPFLFLPISLCHFSLSVPFYFSCSSPWSSNLSLSFSVSYSFASILPANFFFSWILFLRPIPFRTSVWTSTCSLFFFSVFSTIYQLRNCSFSFSLSLSSFRNLLN